MQDFLKVLLEDKTMTLETMVGQKVVLIESGLLQIGHVQDVNHVS